MVKIQLTYQGQLRCEATHGPSGKKLTTDAPVDNHGRGESFSPTDLCATALGACMATIMGIYAERHQIDLTEMTIDVEKHMVENPRRIGKLVVTFHMPAGIPDKHRSALERAAHTCPVHQSLHPEIEKVILFEYGN